MLCYSTGSLPDAFSLSKIAETLNGTPFRGVELVLTASMLEYAGDGAYWRKARDGFHAKGLAFRNVHLGAPHLLGPNAHRPGLSSLNEAGRARKADAVCMAMTIANFLECPNVCMTTGLPEEGNNADQQIRAMKGEIANIVKKRPPGLSLLVEQEPEHVISSAAQLKALSLEFSGALGINFDVGHSEVIGEDIGAAIRELGPHLANIHLEDIKGRVHQHKLYGEGDVDFDSVFQALHDIGYRGDYTPDLYPFKNEHVRALDASVAFLRKHGVLTKAL